MVAILPEGSRAPFVIISKLAFDDINDRPDPNGKQKHADKQHSDHQESSRHAKKQISHSGILCEFKSKLA